MNKKLYRVQYFGYYRDVFGTMEDAKREAEFELGMMPFRQWAARGYEIKLLSMEGGMERWN